MFVSWIASQSHSCGMHGGGDGGGVAFSFDCARVCAYVSNATNARVQFPQDER